MSFSPVVQYFYVYFDWEKVLPEKIHNPTSKKRWRWIGGLRGSNHA
jgi:hypothetical protein